MSNSSSVLRFALLEYISKVKNEGEINEDKLDRALDCLSEAFQLDLTSMEHIAKFSLSPTTLVEVFDAGVNYLGVAPAGVSDPGAEFADNELFKKFIANITAKGFFRGVEEGSSEYNDRYEKCVAKFRAKIAAQEEAKRKANSFDATVDATVAAEAPTAADAVKEAEAEELKGEGNRHIAAKNYSSAISCYDAALALSPDGPSSHVFLSNRAAARCHLQQYERAEEDCVRAVALKPDYAKAHSRLGFARFYKRDYAGSVEAYERALQLEPGNAQAQSFLAKARAQQSAGAATTAGGRGASAGGAGGFDMSSLAGLMGGMGGGGGGMPDLAGMMQNPAMMQMAQQMMGNPQMQQMAQQMMSDPAAMSNMMNMMGGGGGGGGGGMPDLAAMMGGMGGGGGAAPSAGSVGGGGGMPDLAALNNSNDPEIVAIRSDPAMAPFFAALESGGPSAAMGFMSDPYVMGKLSALMGKMGGGNN